MAGNLSDVPYRILTSQKKSGDTVYKIHDDGLVTIEFNRLFPEPELGLLLVLGLHGSCTLWPQAFQLLLDRLVRRAGFSAEILEILKGIYHK